MAYARSISQTTSTITNHQLTLTGVGAGSFLVAAVRSSTLLDTVSSFSDNLNGNWTLLGTVDTANRRTRIYYTSNVVAGDTIVTGVTTGNSVWRWCVMEYTGVALNNPIDVSTFISFATTTTPTTPSITTTQANETLLAFISLDTAISTIVPAGGETERFEEVVLLQGQDKAAATVGSYTSSWTLNATQPGAYALLALKSPTSSPSPGVGAINVSGLAPTVLRSTTVSPGVASVSLQGLMPVTTPGQMIPATGVLSLVGGLAPQVIQQTGPNAGTGSAILTLAGLAPTLITTRTVTPSLVTSAGDSSALAPTVLTEWTSKPAAAALSLVTGIANLIKDGSARAVPDTAQLTLQGLTVTSAVPFDGILAPARTNLDLLGLAPDLVQNWILAPPHDTDADILSLVGWPPTVRGRLAWHDSVSPASSQWRTS